MKKLIFIFMIGLVFFSGCKNNIQNTNLIIEETWSFETILVPDTWTYPNPKISISIWTWILLAEFWSKVQNEISYTATEEDKQNWRKWSVVSWYVYTYIYKDLWLKITTSPMYEPYFYEKPDWLILKRNNNIIYLSWTPSSIADYIEVFYKNPKISLEDEIKNNHLPKWCIIETGIFDTTNAYYPSMNGFNVVYIESKDRNLVWDEECSPDKQFPQNDLIISFVMDSKKPNKYYKFSKGDCAPGPCSIFGKIEFF